MRWPRLNRPKAYTLCCTAATAAARERSHLSPCTPFIRCNIQQNISHTVRRQVGPVQNSFERPAIAVSACIYRIYCFCGTNVMQSLAKPQRDEACFKHNGSLFAAALCNVYQRRYPDPSGPVLLSSFQELRSKKRNVSNPI